MDANGDVKKLEPPADKPKGIKNPIRFLIQLIYSVFTFGYVIAISIIKYYLFTPLKDVTDQVVLITGAARGLGRALAIEFANAGTKLALADINETGIEETVQIINKQYPGRAKGYTCDVGHLGNIDRMANQVEEDFGHVDILINNAGIIAGGSILQIEDNYETIINVNLLSHFRIIRRFLPGMLKRNKGQIVAVSSVLSLTGIAYGTAYAASRWGVTGLMESLQDELRKIPGNKVTVTTVCPYFINTSATYTKSWSIRFPEISVENAAKKAIYGIRREERLFTVPRWLYWPLTLRKLLPNKLSDKFKDMAYTDMALEEHVDHKSHFTHHHSNQS